MDSGQVQRSVWTAAFWPWRGRAPVRTGGALWSSRRTLVGFLTLLVLVLVWYLLTDVSGFADLQRVPSPINIVEAAQQILFEGYAGCTLLMQA